MKCAECDRDFPSEMLVPMFVDGGYTKPICALCALIIRNQAHGIPLDTPFHGEVAHYMWEKARDHVGT